MDNQKDTQNTSINSYGHNSSPSNLVLSYNAKYGFVNKKTEKLITALYMVTDYMEVGDAIKGKLRNLGVELLSDIHSLPIISPVEKHGQISVILTRISEILSLVEIAYNIGSISEMNTAIIKKEFNILAKEIEGYQSDNKTSFVGKTIFENQKVSGFNLDEKMFEVGESFKDINPTNNQFNNINIVKDKRTEYNMSIKNNKTYLPSFSTPKQLHQNVSNTENKKDRGSKIIELIKSKKNLPNGQFGLSIKDISIAFSDCSEKTIQRELNDLVYKGQIKKTGAKRWSRYQSL